jgi:serpin B
VRRLAPCLLLALAVEGAEATPAGVAFCAEPSAVQGDGEAVRRAVSVPFNTYSFDLFAELGRSGDRQLVASPLSAATVLSMLLAGAKGSTATELWTALRLPGPPDARWRERAGKALAAIACGDASLRLAQALFAHERRALLPPFVEIAARHFDAAVETLDFRRVEPSRQRINQWVSERTSGRIPELLKASVLTPDVRLVAVNAAYFKGSWVTAFTEGRTGPAPFDGGRGGTVQMMRGPEKGTSLWHATVDGVEAVALPFREREVEMIVALTPEVTGRQAAALEAALAPTRVRVELPRFTMRSASRLEDAHRALGVAALFDPQSADLSGIDGGPAVTGQEPLYVGAIVHEAWIKVDEAGAEAAAATAAVARGGRAKPVGEPPLVVFRADRPFTFWIRHRPTGLVLFIGRHTSAMR